MGERGERGEWGGKVLPPSGNCKYGPGDIALWLLILVSTSDTTSWEISGGFSITVIRPVLLFLGESGEWDVDPPCPPVCLLVAVSLLRYWTLVSGS